MEIHSFYKYYQMYIFLFHADPEQFYVRITYYLPSASAQAPIMRPEFMF